MESPKNAPSVSPIKVLLAAFLMTALVIYSYKYLPSRELTLVPGNYTITYYLDKTGTEFLWLNQDERKFRCNYNASVSSYKFCGLDVQLGNGLSEGIDLSVYNNMDAQINYTGSAKVMRFYMRSFSPSFTDVSQLPKTLKYMNTLIPVSELKESLSLSFSELTIPEWWAVSAGIPRELSYPEFNNVVHLGIDIPYPAPEGDHDLQLISIRLTGIYLTKDTWYLIVFGCWAIILLFIAFKRDKELRQTAHINVEDLAKEKVKTQRLKKVSEKYKELAILDTLTGVFNRRGIYQFYENCFDHKSDVTGAIIMLDIDHFKRINDNYGHDVGDKVINAIGKILLASLREQDSVGRWGGEEFIILCIDTDMDGATFLAEKIRSKVESHNFKDVAGLTITVSLGVGPINPNKRFEDNVKHTDAALYKAKEAGRNCWIETDDPI